MAMAATEKANADLNEDLPERRKSTSSLGEMHDQEEEAAAAVKAADDLDTSGLKENEVSYRRSMCKSGHPLECFCEICNDLFCVPCETDHEESHNIFKYNDAEGEGKKKLAMCVETQRGMIETHEKVANMEKTKLREDVNRVKGEIDEYLIQMKDLLNNQVQAIKLDLEKQALENDGTILKRTVRLKQMIRNASAIIEGKSGKELTTYRMNRFAKRMRNIDANLPVKSFPVQAILNERSMDVSSYIRVQWKNPKDIYPEDYIILDVDETIQRLQSRRQKTNEEKKEKQDEKKEEKKEENEVERKEEQNEKEKEARDDERKDEREDDRIEEKERERNAEQKDQRKKEREEHRHDERKAEKKEERHEEKGERNEEKRKRELENELDPTKNGHKIGISPALPIHKSVARKSISPKSPAKRQRTNPGGVKTSTLSEWAKVTSSITSDFYVKLISLTSDDRIITCDGTNVLDETRAISIPCTVNIENLRFVCIDGKHFAVVLTGGDALCFVSIDPDDETTYFEFSVEYNQNPLLTSNDEYIIYSFLFDQERYIQLLPVSHFSLTLQQENIDYEMYRVDNCVYAKALAVSAHYNEADIIVLVNRYPDADTAVKAVQMFDGSPLWELTWSQLDSSSTSFDLKVHYTINGFIITNWKNKLIHLLKEDGEKEMIFHEQRMTHLCTNNCGSALALVLRNRDIKMLVI